MIAADTTLVYNSSVKERSNALFGRSLQSDSPGIDGVMHQLCQFHVRPVRVLQLGISEGHRCCLRSKFRALCSQEPDEE